MLSFSILVVVSVLIAVSIFLVRTKLLQNMQNLGMSLAKSYANEEEVYIQSFRNLMDLGNEYVDELESQEEIQNWLEEYLKKVSVIAGEDTVDTYAVINGEIIAANPWEGDEDFDYTSAEWYQKALEAEGGTIFTDVYTDIITGKKTITMAKELKTEDDVFVMDIYLENFSKHQSTQNLPENCSLYLCDASGNLITSSTKWNLSSEKQMLNVEYLVEGIRDGSLADYDDYILDYDGGRRGVYYHQMSNGWYVILTIPFESVLMGEESLTVQVLSVAGGILFVSLLFLVIRDLMQKKKIRRTDGIMQILTDSFYAIYEIDFENGTYTTIKAHSDIREKIAEKGEYSDFLETLKSLVESSTYQEFEQSFSLDSIRQRVKEQVSDYGGDYRRKFGDVYKWVNVRTLYDRKINPDEVILCFREVDIEKRQQLQHTAILQEALETARESTKAKENFFNHMSHDMRTPLNAVIGFSDLILKNKGDWDKVEDYMHKIRHAGQQLLTLINDILELSRLESGRNVVKKHEFNIEDCVRESAALFEHQAEKEHKTLTLTFNVQDKAVLGESFRIEQILNNLLSNALKYSNAGARVRIGVVQEQLQNQNRYVFTVEDTGIGMSEEFQRHIFEPYSRETHFSKQSVVGTGLGMPIVKSLVQELNGEITVESRLGEGSRFTVILPMAAIKAAGEASKETQKEKKEKFSLKGCKVLLVEDNELNREIATEILQMNEMEVIPACDGAEAVDIFRSSRPYEYDFVLMDMQMPVMDGCTAAREIRGLDREDAQKVPIIAVTANAFQEDAEKAVRSGMNGHISKPIDFDVLIRTLEKFLETGSGESGQRSE